jgi:putative ABC transport system substrate-binding protein
MRCAAASAQSAPALPLIGLVRSSSLDDVGDLVAAFKDGLKSTGHVDGQTVAIELQSAEDRYEALPAIIADLVARGAAVLVGNGAAVRVAKSKTTTIPIVFAVGDDPVRSKLVPSLSQPGGNITGVTFFNSYLGAKKLELIRQLIPAGRPIAVFVNPDSPVSRAEGGDVLKSAHSVGQRVLQLDVRTEADFEAAFGRLVGEHAASLLVTGDALFLSRRDRLVELAVQHAVPAIYSEKLIVADGGLMSYGASITEAYRQAGIYTGRILNGEKPADLPVMQPTRFELSINLKTAKTLGLSIPAPLLSLADDVIE